VDVNKGDDTTPNYRSRLVAKDIRKKGEETIFAPTPPLESLRAILSLAATPDLWMSKVSQWEGEDRVQVSFIDISRAYFNARTDPSKPVYVQLPPEDREHGLGLCGRLNVHMYGTRPAADGWYCEYSETLEASGFVRGESSACVFRHPEKDLLASVHGDDFTTVGPKSSLDWFRQQLELKYELKEASRLGPNEEDDKEGRVLNRVVRWTQDGLEYEGDPRHVEKLLLELGLSGSKPVSTPGLKPSMEQHHADEALPDSKVTHFRGLAARANYLSADRPDC
jgi:hypothetical protein